MPAFGFPLPETGHYAARLCEVRWRDSSPPSTLQLPLIMPTTAFASTAAMPMGMRRFQPRFINWS